MLRLMPVDSLRVGRRNYCVPVRGFDTTCHIGRLLILNHSPVLAGKFRFNTFPVDVSPQRKLNASCPCTYSLPATHKTLIHLFLNEWQIAIFGGIKNSLNWFSLIYKINQIQCPSLSHPQMNRKLSFSFSLHGCCSSSDKPNRNSDILDFLSSLIPHLLAIMQ